VDLALALISDRDADQDQDSDPDVGFESGWLMKNTSEFTLFFSGLKEIFTHMLTLEHLNFAKKLIFVIICLFLLLCSC
jgi:hypothetical protein